MLKIRRVWREESGGYVLYTYIHIYLPPKKNKRNSISIPPCVTIFFIIFIGWNNIKRERNLGSVIAVLKSNFKSF